MWRRIRSSKDCPYANAQCLFNIGVQAPAARTTHPDERPGSGADIQKVVPGSLGVQPYSSGSHPSTRDQGNLSLSRLNHWQPGVQAHPEIVQGTAEFHHQIADTLLP